MKECTDEVRMKPAPKAIIDKETIKKNHFPNLSNLPIKINLDVDDKLLTYNPNVNFIEEGKGYFIFYIDNLEDLRKIFKEKLKRYTQLHNVVLYFKNDNLNDSFKALKFNHGPDSNLPFFKLCSQFIGCGWYKDVLEQANLLADNLTILNKLKDEYSKEKTFNMIKVSEKLFDEGIKVFKKEELINYDKYSKEIEDIKEKKMKEIDKLELISKKIDEYEKEIDPKISIDKKNEFCFILNKFSDYFKEYESLKETKGDEEVKIISNLRKKLDYKLIQNKFKHIQNQSPFLNISINNYQVICDNFDSMKIFIERCEVINFRKNLKQELENKAKNIQPKYQFEKLELTDIKKVAKEIDFTSFENLIDYYDEKINKCDSDLESKISKIGASVIKAGVKVFTFKLGKKNSFENIILKDDDGKEIKISEKEVKRFLDSEEKLKEEKNKMEKEEDKKEKEEDKKENKENVEGKKGNEETKNSEEKILETRRGNLRNARVKSSDFSEENIDDIAEVFKLFQKSKAINKEKEKCVKMRNKINEKYKYNYEYFNALKLFSCLEKMELDNDDYKGILLEEKNKDKAIELREYSGNKLIDYDN